MNNKDMPAYPETSEVEQWDDRKDIQRKEDLKEFTKAALQGLCANSDLLKHYHDIQLYKPDIAKLAAELAEAALAELEKRNA